MSGGNNSHAFNAHSLAREDILVKAEGHADRLREAGDIQARPVICARRAVAGTIEDVRGRIRHDLKVVDVHVRLYVWLTQAVRRTNVGRDDFEGRAHRVGATYTSSFVRVG